MKKKKFNKKRFVLILIITLFLLFILFIILSSIYLKPQPRQVVSTKTTTPSNVTKVKKLSFFENDPILKNISDTYNLPDFNNFEKILLKDSLVKSLPKKGSIRLGIFHFVGDYRKWDKIYYITKASVEQNNKAGDFDIWIHTDYVDDYNGKNLCNTIKTARENNDLGEDTRLNEKEIFFKYFRLISYRDCFGI